MTTLTAFYAEISAELKRGTSFDSQIPNKVKAAMQRIEAYKAGRGDWQHMQYFKRFTISISDPDPTAISLPTNLKKIKFLRFLTTNANTNEQNYTYLKRFDATQIEAISSGLPNGYWQDGNRYLFLDSVVEEDLDFEISCIVGTEYPSVAGDEWDFIERFRSALFPLVMFLLGPTVRMPMGTIQLYQNQFQEALQLLDLEDEELRYSNGNNKLVYTGNR